MPYSKGCSGHVKFDRFGTFPSGCRIFSGAILIYFILNSGINWPDWNRKVQFPDIQLNSALERRDGGPVFASHKNGTKKPWWCSMAASSQLVQRIRFLRSIFLIIITCRCKGGGRGTTFRHKKIPPSTWLRTCWLTISFVND